MRVFPAVACTRVLLCRTPERYLQCASDVDIVAAVARKKEPAARRSGCPVSISLDIFGDRWSLLVIRDLMVRGYRSFKEFQASGEGIATNVLADRLRRLQGAGIVEVGPEPTDGRKLSYRLTEKGIDLAPVLLELLIWGAKHEKTAAPCNVIEEMEKNRAHVIAEARRRWQERDATPLLPKLPDLSRIPTRGTASERARRKTSVRAR